MSEHIYRHRDFVIYINNAFMNLEFYKATGKLETFFYNVKVLSNFIFCLFDMGVISAEELYEYNNRFSNLEYGFRKEENTFMLNSKIVVVIVNVKEEEYKLKDGTIIVGRKVSFDQDGEVATLKCTEDVFNACKTLKFKNATLAIDVNPTADKVPNVLRVVGVEPLK